MRPNHSKPTTLSSLPTPVASRGFPASRWRALTLCLPLLLACNQTPEKSEKGDAVAKASKDEDAKKKQEQEKKEKGEQEAKKKAERAAEKAKELAEKPSFVPSKEFNPDLLDLTKATLTAPEVYRVDVETTKGKFTIEVKRELAPKGADRFYNLVKLGFYDNIAFFRAIDGFMVQFGIHGAPQVNAVWRGARIEDDAVKGSNTRGTLSFAMGGKDTRTSQVFINFGSNENLNSMGFSTFGEVVSGMEIVNSLYKGYGEGAPQGRGPDQGRLQFEGNDYLVRDFPKLDYIKKATIVGDAPAATAHAEEIKPADSAKKADDKKPLDSATKVEVAAAAAELNPVERLKQAKAKEQELAKALDTANALVRKASEEEKKAKARVGKATTLSDQATSRVEAARKAAEQAKAASDQAKKDMTAANAEAEKTTAQSTKAGAEATSAKEALEKAKAEIAAAQAALRDAEKAEADKRNADKEQAQKEQKEAVAKAKADKEAAKKIEAEKKAQVEKK